jgi:hypothetical protein
MEQTEYNEDKRKKKKRLILLLLLLLLSLVLTVLFIFFQNSPDPEMFLAGNTLPEGRHASEILEIMQEAVDASQITMQVNTVIDFETPTSYGNVGIINPSINIFPIAMDFVLNETGEVIFTSGAIQPNQYISSAPLDVKLPIGVHQATAIFNAYDPETLEHIWESNVALTINIGQ